MKIDIRSISPTKFAISAFMIHICEDYAELVKTENKIHASYADYDILDFKELKAMIKSQRNRIDRNKQHKY